MPRYEPNPTNVSFGFLVYPKGSYRVEISSPKAFESKDASGKVKNYGIRFAGKILTSIDQPSFVGKPHPITLYMHTPGAESFSKQIQAAALGCRKDAEFNEKYGDKKWGFDTEDGSVDDGWHLMDGQVLDITYDDVKVGDNGDEQSGNARYSVVG